MNITSVAVTQKDNTLQSAIQQWHVALAVGAAPLQFFRQVMYIRLATGSTADSISIDAANTSLKAKFQSYVYKAQVQIKALNAGTNEAVVVTLDAPRQIHQIHLSSGTTSGSGYSLEFYRLDGDAIADKPTVTTAVANNIATLSESDDFRDARFAIRLRASGTHRPLLASNISELHVRSYPTGPRIGIVYPDKTALQKSEDLSSRIFFWQQPGEITAADANQSNVDAGQNLAAELQRYLDTYFDDTSLPETIEVALVIESDSPCILNVTAFNVAYHPATESLTSSDGKKVEKCVLRFAGDRVSSQDVPIPLPSNATITSATVETVQSFHRDRPTSGNYDILTSAVLNQKEGIAISVEKWAALCIKPPQAISVSGIAFGVMALSKKTELLVELQEDWHGQPSGKKLAGGTIALEQPGLCNWVTLLFSKATALPAQSHWILVKAASGRAVWLANSGTGTSSVRILDRPSEMAVWSEVSILNGLEALYQLISHSDKAQKQQPATLSIGTHTVARINTANGSQTFDVTNALKACLADQPSSSITTTVPLTFTAIARGIITVYPPHIEYDIN